ncbi:MAG: hypothetical protein IPM51_15255 [Sphingobacteriaceae bacterium]|nr:hypothetical protein [Sphingobacteriaceae bacterium]
MILTAHLYKLKALDKTNEEVSRIYDLARICTANEAWDAAYRCYEYIIQKGPNNLFYDGARADILHVEYKAHRYCLT